MGTRSRVELTVKSLQTPHYDVEEIAEGIHGAIARGEGSAICNSGLLDLGNGALVFDTGLTRDSAVDLKSLTVRTIHRAPTLVVLSHWHLDHSLGNAEFSGVPSWGTARTYESLLEMKPQLEAELQRESLEIGISELEAKRDQMRTEGARADLEFVLHINRLLLATAGRSKVAPPDHTFERRLTIPADRPAELMCFGAGHTQADAILWLPREKVVFAGDLVCLGIEPSMGSGNPSHWLEVLDEIVKLRPERIVPGHGPVTTVDGIEETRGYVSGVLEAARGREGERLPPSIRRWEGSVSLEENLAFTRGWLSSHPESG